MTVVQCIALGACVLLGACQSADSSRESQNEASPANPNAKPARWADTSAARVKQGRASFGACMGCHGDKAEGRVGIGPRIASESYLAAASDDFLFKTIKEGRAGTTMIPWGTSYSDEQIESIVAYLRSMHPTEPAKLNDAPLAGDAAKGESVYTGVCSGCHGRSGAGYQETSNGTGIGRKAFLDSASDGFIRYIVGHGKSLTKMKGFNPKAVTAVANLSEQEIEDTIAYLRKNAW